MRIGAPKRRAREVVWRKVWKEEVMWMRCSRVGSREGVSVDILAGDRAKS